MEQNKADSCVFRKIVDGKVSLNVCNHVEDLVVTAKD